MPAYFKLQSYLILCPSSCVSNFEALSVGSGGREMLARVVKVRLAEPGNSTRARKILNTVQQQDSDYHAQV